MVREYLDYIGLKYDYDRWFAEARIELAERIGELVRERCRDVPFPAKIKCIKDEESRLFALVTHAFAIFPMWMLYPRLLEYEIERERLLLYEASLVEMYDPYYGWDL